MIFWFCSASHAAADIVTFTIGEFQWDDPFGFGPEFRILNFSDTPQFATGEIPDDFVGGPFVDLSLTVDGSSFVEDAELAAGQTLSFLGSPSFSAFLSFSFLSHSYSLLLAQVCDVSDPAACLPPPDEFGGQFASRLIDFQIDTSAEPVTESTSSFALMSVALAIVALRARKRA